MDGWNKKPLGWETIETCNSYSNEKLDIPYNLVNNIYSVEGIFVLAGGIDDNGICYPWVTKRLDLAYQIYKQIDKPIFCLGGGSYHIPPKLNKNNFVIHESTSCSEYLISLNVCPSKIYREWSSYDTIANGFFGFTNFIIPLKLKSIIVITSNFHIERAKEIFLWMKLIFNIDINIYFLPTCDKNIDVDIIKIRTEREKRSLKSLKENVIINIDSLEKFHKWFFTEHKAYCSNIEIIRKTEVNNLEKKTY